MEILLGVVIGVVLTVTCTLFLLWRWLQRATARAQALVMQAAQLQGFRCEWVDPHLLVFDMQDRFLAQGRTLQELRDRLSEKFGNDFDCTLNFKGLPPEVRSRLAAESRAS